MKHRLNFIIGITILVVAGTLAFTISQRPASDTARTSETARQARQGEPHQRPPNRMSLPDAHPHGSSGPSGTRAGIRAADSSAANRNPVRLSVAVDPAHPRSAELAPSAKRVESHARARLQQLTRSLDLTADQQNRVFPLLVRASQSYDPGMSVVPTGRPASLPPSANSSPSSVDFPLARQGQPVATPAEGKRSAPPARPDPGPTLPAQAAGPSPATSADAPAMPQTPPNPVPSGTADTPTRSKDPDTNPAATVAPDPSPGPPPIASDELQSLIANELDPGQKNLWVEQSVTDLILWEEIIGVLISQLDQQSGLTNPGTNDPAATAPQPGDLETTPLPTSRGGRTLLD